MPADAKSMPATVIPTSLGGLLPHASAGPRERATDLEVVQYAVQLRRLCGVGFLPPPGLELGLPPGLAFRDKAFEPEPRSLEPLSLPNPYGDVSGESPSREHHSRGCKPCLYYYSGNCRKGLGCTFCHLQHDKKFVQGVRPSKRTRRCLERRSLLTTELAAAAGGA